jgi:hypothetical protein
MPKRLVLIGQSGHGRSAFKKLAKVCQIENIHKLEKEEKLLEDDVPILLVNGTYTRLTYELIRTLADAKDIIGEKDFILVYTFCSSRKCRMSLEEIRAHLKLPSQIFYFDNPIEDDDQLELNKAMSVIKSIAKVME